VTRAKVPHAVVYAKKVESDDNIIFTDDTPGCQAVREMAGDNIFELSNADD
jgi:hypothetical protein